MSDNSGKWGTSRVMASMAGANSGAKPPLFAPSGAKDKGATFLGLFGGDVLPPYAAIAAANCREFTFSFTQDGSTSHGYAAVLKAIKA